MSQEPSIGHIVHYVLRDGEHRPAIITHVDSNDYFVNLQVFNDGHNDNQLSSGGTSWRSSVENDEEFKEENTWHWPERTS